MPRKNPLPIREREICHRLLSARKALRLTRVAFAREAGIDSSELRRYEEARSPLLARSALALCHAHGFGLPWLATGKESPVVGPHVPVLSEQTGIPERALFSKVFDESLAMAFARNRARVTSAHSRLFSLLDKMDSLLDEGKIPESLRLEAVERVRHSLTALERDRGRRTKLARLVAIHKEKTTSIPCIPESPLTRATVAKPHKTKAPRRSKK